MPFTSIKASDLGCALNCLVATGLRSDGGAPTDDTAILNAFLAGASASNPVELILDGCALVTGLIIAAAGHTTIRGVGHDSGLFMAAGSNADAIRIGPYSLAVPDSEGSGVATPSRSASNIVLLDFAVNGNAGANTTGSSAYVTPANAPIAGAVAHPVYGVILTNVSGVHIDRLKIFNCPTYALCFANADDITVASSKFASSTNLQDGIHIDGPAENIRLSDLTFATGDDAIALNAPEGFAGDISDVTVSNCTFENSWAAMRVYTSIKTGASCKVRRVVVSNCVGRTQRACFNLGIEGSQTAGDLDQIRDFKVIGGTWSSQAEGLAFIRTNAGEITFADVTYQPITASPVVQFGANSLGALKLGVTILRNPDANAAPPLAVLYIGGGSDPGLGALALTEIRVVDELGSSYAALPSVVSGNAPIAALRIGSLDMAKFSALIDAGSTPAIAAISGAGVSGTGVQIADSQMANGSLYVSSTSPHAGKLCVKVGGTVAVLTS